MGQVTRARDKVTIMTTTSQGLEFDTASRRLEEGVFLHRALDECGNAR